jgi:uncharacterized protein YhfF
MRDRLNALVLSGQKRATAGLWKLDYLREGERIDAVGERQALLDSDDQPLAVVEITRVESHRFSDVPFEFAIAEGEGFRSIEHWRDGHRAYYEGEGALVADDDLVVCVWMEVCSPEPLE